MKTVRLCWRDRSLTFERLTDPARHAISSAQDEAIALGHRWIGTEHLLLGLINVRDGMAGAVLDERGVKVAAAREQTLRIVQGMGEDGTGGHDAADALAAIGIDVEEVRRRADESFGPGRVMVPRLPFTPRVKEVLERGLRESVSRKHSCVGTEHLLLGLLAEGESTANRVLANLSVTHLRQTLLERMVP
ncbi:Clp protease N-terminal domain-containing protein [Lentzea tibetensis]|uniref:Clp protease N-terminal domain-containing protein n=1 Tax=Lentzea tibetensis TaxID=2591470 RepID=UPI0016440392|nr:Clp protease N-terminal domain-containing protein [Lentzea tibetensis]